MPNMATTNGLGFGPGNRYSIFTKSNCTKNRLIFLSEKIARTPQLLWLQLTKHSVELK